MAGESMEGLPRQKWYVRIGAKLREDIVTGRFSPGDRLPTEKQLAESFGVSVQTVRQAQQYLVQEGLIRKEQGRGTFVSDLAKEHRRVVLVCGLDLAAKSAGREAISPYYQDSIRFCQEGARTRGLAFDVVWQGNCAPDAGAAGRAGDPAGAVSGYIFLGCDTIHPLVQRARREGLHYVQLGKPSHGERTVWFDFADAAQRVWEAIRQRVLDHRLDVVVVSITGEQYGAQTLAQLVPGGIRFLQVPNCMSVWEYERWAYHGIRRVCAGRSQPAAFVFLDDILARGGTRALLQAGMGDGRCPVAVVCGRQEIESYGMPVSYAVHDTALEAEWALDMLVAQIEGAPSGVAGRQSPFALADVTEPVWEPWDKAMADQLDSMLAGIA